MADITIDLNDLPWPTNPDILLFSKQNWASPWVLQKGVLVEEVVWTIAPEVSAATFQWRYGNISYGGPASNVAPLVGRGDWILILVPLEGAQPSYMPWIGYADLPITLAEDDVSGVQRVPCYGFDRVLKYSPIRSTVAWAELEGSDPVESTWVRKDTATPFNRGYDEYGVNFIGNRSDDLVKLDPGDDDPSVYVFGNGNSVWSSQQMAEHLSVFHLPTTTQIPGLIPWTTLQSNLLPDWDEIMVKTEGRTLHDVLTQIAGADRQLGWRVMPTVVIGGNGDAEENVPTVTNVNIEFFTVTGTGITIPGQSPIPPNQAVLTVIHDEDPLTDSTIDEDDSDMVDQVIVRGPFEIGVGTFRYGDEFINGWDQLQLDEYNEGYSTDPIWTGKSLTEKRELNQVFRDLPTMEEVYRNFPMKDDWDGTVNSGNNLFWKLDPNDAEEPTYVPDLYNVPVGFFRRLPLYGGVEYKGPVASVDETGGRRTLPILAYIANPDRPGSFWPVQWQLTDFGGPRIAGRNALPYDLEIKPLQMNSWEPGFEFIVKGAPQHAHRTTNFIGNAADPEKANPQMWGNTDSETIIITAAMQSDRRPEWRIPDVVAADFVRKKYITLEHPSLRHVHIAKDTVIGIDKDFVPEKSDGGTLRDPFPQLEALATMASQRLLAPRRTAKINSGRVVFFATGAFVSTINGATVDGVISEVRIVTPVIEDASPPPLRMHVEVVDNLLDLSNLMPRPPGSERFAT